MDRRDFLDRVAAGPSREGPGGQEAPNVVTGRRVEWRLASSYPRNLDILHGAAEYVAERVAQLTGDRFTLRVFPPGEIVPGLGVMDAVQQRTVQAGLTAGYYYVGKSPALAFDTAVPFGLSARQRFAWLYRAGGRELLQDVYADFGVHAIPLGSTGGQMGGWFRRPLDGLDDLRGLRMRIPGIGGEIMTRLGVSVQVLAGADVYPALERGAIDAVEWVGPYDDERLGLHQIAENYYYPGWWEPGVTTTLQVGRRAWDELPSLYREALEGACREATLLTLARYDAANPSALERLVEEHGVRLRRFSDDVMEAAWEESRAYLEEQAAADDAFRTVYESFADFRSVVFPYFAGNELAFARFAFPKLGI